MWKKIVISLILVILILSGLYWVKTYDKLSLQQSPEENLQPQEFSEEIEYKYEASALSENCMLNSEMACAVDFAVKCTLNPDYKGCRQSKLPRFIFMEDENLKRPTEISFKISKIKPISAEMVEFHTDSTCNGNWFGLCQGKVIYVLVPYESSWRVKDIYAIEHM